MLLPPYQTKRQCIFCGAPIAECMGYVLPRDVLACLENRFPKGVYPREICPKFGCSDRWQEYLASETDSQ